MEIYREKKIAIFTALTELSGDQLGESLDYKLMFRELSKHGFEVEVITPSKSTIDDYESKVYDSACIRKIVRDNDYVILGAYPPLEVVYECVIQNTPIIYKMYEIGVVASFDFGFEGSVRVRKAAFEYERKVQSVLLETGSFFICSSEKMQNYIVGALAASGFYGYQDYDLMKAVNKTSMVLPHVIESRKPRKNKSVYRNVVNNIGSKDYIVLVNGGLWNWFDSRPLIESINRLVNRGLRVKLVFQGYKGASIIPTVEANNALSLAEDLGLLNENIFFFEDIYPNSDRADYLLEADLSVILSRDYNYGTRNRIFDCLWAGTPMILSQSDCFAMEVTKNNLGIALEDHEGRSLDEAIENVIQGREKYTKNVLAYRDRVVELNPLNKVVAFINSNRFVSRDQERVSKLKGLVEDAIASGKRLSLEQSLVSAKYLPASNDKVWC